MHFQGVKFMYEKYKELNDYRVNRYIVFIKSDYSKISEISNFRYEDIDEYLLARGLSIVNM